MGTTAREFWGDRVGTEDDGAYGSDVRKLVTAEPGTGSITTTIARFPAGSGTNAEIIYDPLTTRNALGVVDGFGWVVNFSTADGMQSTATDKRYISAGAWRFRGRINPPLVARSHRLRFRVYRVAAAPGRARTLLFTHTAPARDDVVGYDVDQTTGAQAEIVLEADESVQVSPAMIQDANDALVSHDFVFVLGGGAVGELQWQVTVPSPGVRTRAIRSHTNAAAPAVALQPFKIKLPRTVAASGAVVLGRRKTSKSFAAAASGTTTFARRLTLARTFSVAGNPTVAVTKKSFKVLSVVATNGVVFARRLILARSFAVAGVPGVVFARRLVMRRTFTVAGASGIAFSRIVRARRSVSVAATSGVLAVFKIAEALLDRISGGGPPVETVVKKLRVWGLGKR